MDFDFARLPVADVPAAHPLLIYQAPGTARLQGLFLGRSSNVGRNNAGVNAALAVPVSELATAQRAHWDDGGRIAPVPVNARRGFNGLLVIGEIIRLRLDDLLSKSTAGATEGYRCHRRDEYD
jgi:hypothetical protein